jgi:exonuclease SbcD
VTATYATAAATMPQVAYAALGHIHRPQAVSRTGFPTYYAGSPLQLDFGEVGENKSLVVVTAEPSRPAHPEIVPLRAGRRLLEVTGSLHQIAMQADMVGDAIVKVLVDTETPTPHLADLVAQRLPKASLALVEERCAATRMEALDRSTAGDTDTEPDISALFRDFLAETGTKRANVDHVFATFSHLLVEAQVADVSDGGHDCGKLPEEELLAAVLVDNPVPRSVTARLIDNRRPAPTHSPQGTLSPPRRGQRRKAASTTEQAPAVVMETR